MTPYLLVDNVRVPPEHVEKTQLRFRVRLPASEIRLISAWAPSADFHRPSSGRRLGVLLRKVSWSRGDVTRDVPLDSPALVDGFHHVEIHNPQAGPVRWTTGDAALPPLLFPPWEGDALLHLTLADWRDRVQETPVSSESTILSRFEGLGEDCEFGAAQRRYLVEPPLSLFRWGGAPAERLIEGLESRFERLADPDITELVRYHNEYFLRTPYVAIHTHCIVEQDADGRAEVLRTGRATLRILRRKFLKDISDGSRIFVFKSCDPTFDEIGMRRLHAALRSIGPAGLLCAKLAPPGQRVGAVRLAEGLYVGYLERFFMPTSGPYDQWVAICAETLALHERG